MPFRNPQEKGLRQEWSRRYGVNGFPECGGLNKEGDPSTILPHELWTALNCRYSDGYPVCRGGQETVSDALAGCIVGITDVEDVSAFLLSMKRLDRYNPDAPTPYVRIDDGSYPIHLTLTSTSGQDAPRHNIFRMGDRIMAFASDNYVYDVVLPPVGASPQLTKYTRQALVPNFVNAVVRREVLPSKPNFDGSDPAIEIGDVAYIGGIEGTAAVYNGTTTKQETGVGAGRILTAIYHEDIYGCGDVTLYRRTPETPTTPVHWDSAASFPGGLSNFFVTDAIEYKNKLYISAEALGLPDAGFGFPALAAIFVFDISTGVVTIAHQPLTANTNLDVALSIGAMEVYNGRLCYMWVNGFNDIWIGTYDGSTWDDITTSVFHNESTRDMGDLATDNNRLYVVAGNDPALVDPRAVFLKTGELTFSPLQEIEDLTDVYGDDVDTLPKSIIVIG